MTDPSSSRGPSVLVVDDHRISREYTVAALREIAGSVNQAASAVDALRTALRSLPDVICMDIELSGASGLDLVGRIRESWPPGKPYPRVFVLSAGQPSPEHRAAVGDAVDGFLVKPVGPRQLRAMLAPAACRAAPTAAAPIPLPELRRLFRQELLVRLDELDRCVRDRDLGGAGTILHQLIASSGLCRERELESRMRAMLAVCRNNGTLAGLARSYYSLWVKARYYLESDYLDDAA